MIIELQRLFVPEDLGCEASCGICGDRFQTESIRLALRCGLHRIDADAQLGGQGVADEDHRAASQGAQQQGGGARSLVGAS